MKREWTLCFAALMALLALYITSRLALDRGAAGGAARVNPLVAVAACTLVSILTLPLATSANRSWRHGPAIGSRDGWAFVAVTVVSVWGAALVDQNTPLVQVYAIPELLIALAYCRAFAVAAVMNFGLVAVQALGGEPTPDNLPRWTVVAVATMALTRLLGKPTDLLAETNMRDQEFVEQLQIRDAQITRLSHLEETARERERITREMHDTIAQGLASILVSARAAAAEVTRAGSVGPSVVGATRARSAAVPANGAGTDRQASWHLAMIIGLVQGDLDGIRWMIADTSPRASNGRGLTEAVGRVADRLEHEGITVAHSFDSTLPPLPQPTRVAILRTARKAIANIVRRSWAANVVVSFQSVAGMTVLEVRGDGVGFDSTTAGVVDAEGGSPSNQVVLRSRPEPADEGRASLACIWRV